MTDKLQETIKKELAELPKEMQEAVNSIDWVKIAEDIGKKYNLEENQISNFQLETLLALIGVTDLEFFPTNIENQVETPKTDAENMAREALEKIFAPIRSKTEESVKKDLKNKNPNWEQTLNFVLSGGDYLTLMNKENESLNGSINNTTPIAKNINPPTLAEIQAGAGKNNIVAKNLNLKI